MKKNKAELENNRIHMHQIQNEVSPFPQKEHRQKKKNIPIATLFCIWIGLFFLSLFFVVAKNQWNFSLAWEMKYASLNLQNFYQFVSGSGAADGMDIRFYQYVCISLTGAALAACGAVFQGTFKNVLAGPSTMGVMAGGTLGCSCYLLFCVPAAVGSVVTTANLDAYAAMTLWERYQQQFCTLAGCAAGVLLVTVVATVAGRGKLSASTMVVAGTVFTTIIGNINMLIQYYMILKDPEDTRIDGIRDMMMGNFNHTTTSAVVAMMGIPILSCLIVLICVSGKLNLLSLGAEEARTMGISVERYRNLMILAGTVLTAVVVAFCGQIGFLGFMVPLLVRKIVGPDMRVLLPASMLCGALFLIVIFDVAYFIGMTDYLNVVTSGIGCVVMVLVILRKGGKKHAVDKKSGQTDLGIR